ncbi:unnamed protein product [Pleuronectes platessa]|uniref:Uncharacterized protein n=1 Tax=Pleuronectes platessa TaxID=8262 RepID=A0A9N7TVH9_PLEPL|nr:unnamed protein product [Pleuronectes platessa]
MGLGAKYSPSWRGRVGNILRAAGRPAVMRLSSSELGAMLTLEEVMRFRAPSITRRMRNLIIKERHVAPRLMPVPPPKCHMSSRQAALVAEAVHRKHVQHLPLSKAPYSPNICSPGAVHGCQRAVWSVGAFREVDRPPPSLTHMSEGALSPLPSRSCSQSLLTVA